MKWVNTYWKYLLNISHSIRPAAPGQQPSQRQLMTHDWQAVHSYSGISARRRRRRQARRSQSLQAKGSSYDSAAACCDQTLR